MTQDNSTFTGLSTLTSGGSAHNSHALHIEAHLDERRTHVPVKIVAVHGGGLGPAPTVDVMPLVDQVDGLNNRTAHAVVYNIPVSRNQSASGAVINDPAVGDMGLMAIADRDISQFKNTSAQSGPPTKRKGNLADGVFHRAMCIPGTPKQYLMFKPAGGIVLADQAGNVVETFATGSNTITVTPPDGKFVLLGGNGTKGSFDFLQTVSGMPSINCKTRIS